MATGPCRVLVVDDALAAYGLIEGELRQQRSQCALAARPERAIAPHEGAASDLIFGDILTPRLSGLGVVVSCRSHCEARFLPSEAAPACHEVCMTNGRPANLLRRARSVWRHVALRLVNAIRRRRIATATKAD